MPRPLRVGPSLPARIAESTGEVDQRHASADVKRKTLLLMLEGKRTTEIQRELGVSRKTQWRWRCEPEFARQLEDAQEEQLKAGQTEWRELVLDAVDFLKEVMRDECADVADRRWAVEQIMSLSGWKDLAARKADSQDGVSTMSFEEIKRRLREEIAQESAGDSE